MSKKRRSFSLEFKEEAVQMLLNTDISAAELARDLGINENMLRRWKKQYESGYFNEKTGTTSVSPKDKEIQELKKQLRRVSMERDILKKAVAIFSEDAPK